MQNCLASTIKRSYLWCVEYSDICLSKVLLVQVMIQDLC